VRAAVLGLSAVASVAVWASLRMPTSQQAIVAQPLVASASPELARTGTNLDVAPNDAGPDQTAAEPASDSEHIQTVDSPASVLHQESPNVPAGALKTVRGHIKFAVRVRVDSAGNVVYASLASHSPSPYFTRIALDTARKWRFVAADGQLARHWMLWFEFTRDSATTHANASELRQARGD